MQEALDQIGTAVTALAQRDPHTLPDSTLLETVETLLFERDRINGILATHLQVIDTRGATSVEYGRQTRAWLVEDRRLAHEEALKLMTVAKALPYRSAIEAALLAGDINLDHARNIATSTRRVPASIQDTVEKELVAAAEQVDPTSLGRFAREIRSRLGGDESAEAAEQRKYDDRWLTLTRTFDGMHRVDGMLDPASAAVVKTALAPMCRKTGDGDDRTVGQRRADGLVMLANLGLRSGELPEIGGERPHLLVTLPWQGLAADTESSAAAARQIRLDGLEVSPSTARMIACDAGIIPAVLGADGEVLDLGRKTSVWSVAQRRALNLEFPGCGWPGCQTGLGHCQAHHIEHFAHGGRTDVRNGVNLCWYHHNLIHHSSWKIGKQRGKVQVWRT